MPTGPKGLRRTADVIGNAIKVAAGEDEEDIPAKPEKNEAAAEMGRKGGAAASFKCSWTSRSAYSWSRASSVLPMARPAPPIPLLLLGSAELLKNFTLAGSSRGRHFHFGASMP